MRPSDVMPPCGGRRRKQLAQDIVSVSEEIPEFLEAAVMGEKPLNHVLNLEMDWYNQRPLSSLSSVKTTTSMQSE